MDKFTNWFKRNKSLSEEPNNTFRRSSNESFGSALEPKDGISEEQREWIKAGGSEMPEEVERGSEEYYDSAGEENYESNQPYDDDNQNGY